MEVATMPSSSDRKRLELPAYLYDQLVDISVEEDRTVSSVAQEIVAAGLRTREAPIVEERDFRRFTERARLAVDHAREEALSWRHDYIGTEHLLLGLLSVKDGVAARVLDQLGLDYEKCSGFYRRLQQGTGHFLQPRDTLPPTLPYLTRSRRVLRTAIDAADRYSTFHVGTEHILIGLALVRDGFAAHTMAYFGVLNEVEGETLRAIWSPFSKEDIETAAD